MSIEDLLQAPQRGFENFYGLAYFFIEMVGVSWSNNDLWYQNFQLCQWFGVQCLFLDTFSSLDLQNNKLQGQIPTIIGSVPTLLLLDLSANPSISGTIPSELSKITALSQLALADAQLSGSIPTEFGELTRANFLNFANNSLSGTIPSEIFGIETLETFAISNNDLSGSIPSEIGEATGLVILQLGRNELTGLLPSEISNLSRLEYLNLRNNQLSGSIPSSIWELTTLEMINFVDSGLDMESIPANACEASQQR
ncbi:MAG: hypothetical protein SGILL_003086, partial [Bacillariaceae sp.]